jgi:hypothetical protein
MIEKKRIKVIKKGQAEAIAKPKPAKSKSKRAAAREIVANVSEWVAELQARKSRETKQALEQLFATSPTPSEL